MLRLALLLALLLASTSAAPNPPSRLIVASDGGLDPAPRVAIRHCSKGQIASSLCHLPDYYLTLFSSLTDDTAIEVRSDMAGVPAPSASSDAHVNSVVDLDGAHVCGYFSVSARACSRPPSGGPASPCR